MGRVECAVLCCPCCCGFLPIIALGKGLITLPLCLLILVFGCGVASIIALPHDFVLMYRAVCCTGLIGPKLKVLMMLLMWFPLLLWPVVVLIGSTAVGICMPIGYGLSGTFDDEQSLLFGGCLVWHTSDYGEFFPSIRLSFRIVRDFWDFNWHAVFAQVEEIRISRVANPVDIRVCAIVVCFVQSLLCGAILMVLISLIVVVKGVPMLPSAYWRLFRECCKILYEEKCGCRDLGQFFGIWVVGPVAVLLSIAAIPVMGPLGGLVCIVAGSFAGVHCAILSYQHGCCVGFKQVSNVARVVDLASTALLYSLVFGHEPRSEPRSCFPEFSVGSALVVPFPEYDEETDDNGVVGRAGGISMQTIWDNFFEQCELVTADALDRSYITLQQVESIEPTVVLGIPAVVILNAARRSVDTPGEGWVLSDSVVLTPENRPRNAIADKFIEPAIALKHSLKEAALDEVSMTKLVKAAMLQDGDLVQDITSVPPASQLLADANRVATMISRLPQFRRRFSTSLSTGCVLHASRSGGDSDLRAGATAVGSGGDWVSCDD